MTPRWQTERSLTKREALKAKIKDAMEMLIELDLQPSYDNYCKHFGPCKAFAQVASNLIESGEVILPPEMEETREKACIGLNAVEKRIEEERDLYDLRLQVLIAIKTEFLEATGTDVLPQGFLPDLQLPESGASYDTLFLWFSSWNSILLARYREQNTRDPSEACERGKLPTDGRLGTFNWKSRLDSVEGAILQDEEQE